MNDDPPFIVRLSTQFRCIMQPILLEIAGAPISQSTLKGQVSRGSMLVPSQVKPCLFVAIGRTSKFAFGEP